jgi:hypothetical protein
VITLDNEIVDDELNDEVTDEVAEVESEEESLEFNEEIELSKPDDEESDEGELIVTIGDDQPAQDDEDQKAPEWVRTLRKTNKEIQRENRKLREQLQRVSAPAEMQVKLPEKPTLEGSGYDAEEYEKKLANWFEQKRSYDVKQAEIQQAQQAEQQAWQDRLKSYGERKAQLKVKDFNYAEENVLSSLSETQQGVILQGADDPAVLVYAIGNNEAKLKELSNIKDPVKFSFAVAKLETQLKVRNRKAPPPTDKRVDDTAPKSGIVDSTLDKLRAEASRTGNFSKVIAYNKKKRK